VCWLLEWVRFIFNTCSSKLNKKCLINITFSVLVELISAESSADAELPRVKEIPSRSVRFVKDGGIRVRFSNS
jgi:hypothetical protein